MRESVLASEHFDEAVDVLTDAFRDYPVMRYVLGPQGVDAPRLRRLIGLFAAGRFLRGEPVLGVRDAAGALLGVATTTPPGDRPAPPGFLDLREATWLELGADARQRYEAFGAATQQFAIPDAHHHLNMLGVRRAHQGRGLARVLLDAVHALAVSDPGSAGVSLTTENRRNLGLYERFGYRIQGQTRVSDELETWTLYRPRGVVA